MKIIATLHRTVECDWKIRILPRKDQDGRYESELYDVWKPTKGEEVLLFNPSISLVIRGRQGTEPTSVLVPIHLVYTLEHCLSSVYERLHTKGLYRSEGGTLYMDGNIAGKTAVKLSLYRASLIMIPSVVIDKFSNKTLRGIRLTYDGNTIGNLQHTEVREICELLNHLDVNAYTMVLALAEKLTRMDQKMDKIIDGQSMILSILKNQGINTGGSGNTWTPGRF